MDDILILIRDMRVRSSPLPEITRPMYPILGSSAGIRLPVVQCGNVTLEEPPCWSRLTSTPSKYKIIDVVSNMHWRRFKAKFLCPSGSNILLIDVIE